MCSPVLVKPWQERSVEEQNQVVLEAQAVVRVHMSRLRLKGAVVVAANYESFRDVPEAMEALKVYYREYSRRTRMKEGARATERSREWRRAHPESVRRASRRYQQTHMDVYRRAIKRHRAACYEMVRAQEKEYYRTHPEMALKHRLLRRARLAGAAGSFSVKEFRGLCMEFEGKCAYCGRDVKLVSDHMTPLSRGGANFIWNIIPACQHCNDSKGSKTFEEYVSTLGWDLEVNDD